jgi:hypothetical protein
MVFEHLVPDNPLVFIQRCVKERKIRWTFHVNMRLKGRFISRETLLESVSAFEIIEEYPKDKYLPSYLIYSQHQGSIFMCCLLWTYQEIMFVSLLLTIPILKSGKRI